MNFTIKNSRTNETISNHRTESGVIKKLKSLNYLDTAIYDEDGNQYGTNAGELFKV